MSWDWAPFSLFHFEQVLLFVVLYSLISYLNSSYPPEVSPISNQVQVDSGPQIAMENFYRFCCSNARKAAESVFALGSVRRSETLCVAVR